MDINTQKLIEGLAEKLGVTVEHLWSVLTKQAPITATINLLTLIGMVVAFCSFVWLWKKVFDKMKQDECRRATEGDYQEAESYVPLCVCYIILCIISLIFICTRIFDLPNTLAGYTNPEYWALQQLGVLKN